PFSIEPTRQKRGDSKRKRNRRADVAEVEIRRMNRHSRILQLRIQSAAVYGNEVEPLERIRAEADRCEKEQQNERQRSRDVRHQLAIARAIGVKSDRRINRQNQRPEKQRPRSSAPEGREGVDLRQNRAG